MLFFISIIAPKKKVPEENLFLPYPTHCTLSLSHATWLFYLDELGATRLTSLGSLGLSLNLFANSSILGINSPILKGLLTTSSMPAASKVAICSLLAFAVTAMIGTWPFNFPCCSNSRIFEVHCRPSMTGISLSMRTTEMSVGEEVVDVGDGEAQKLDNFRASRASPPWFATIVWIPWLWSCRWRTFWLTSTN